MRLSSHWHKFQFIESAAQTLHRKKQRIAFWKNRIIYIENPLKSYDFSGFSGPSDWFRTSGLVVPNRNRKLFSDVSSDFSSFPLVFRYSRTLFWTPISACSARVCSNPCGQKRFPPGFRWTVTGAGREAFLVAVGCIVTLRRVLCKWFLSRGRLKGWAAIDKELAGR